MIRCLTALPIFFRVALEWGRYGSGTPPGPNIGFTFTIIQRAVNPVRHKTYNVEADYLQTTIKIVEMEMATWLQEYTLGDTSEPACDLEVPGVRFGMA
jgi:hypothetical protein